MSLGKAWPCLAALQRAYNHCPRTLRTNNPEKAPQGLSLPSLTSLELPQGSKRLQVKMSKGPGPSNPLRSQQVSYLESKFSEPSSCLYQVLLPPKDQKSRCLQTVKKRPGCQGNWFLKDLYMPMAGAQPWVAWDFKDDPVLKGFQKSLSLADPKSHCPSSPDRGTRKMPLRRSILSHLSSPAYPGNKVTQRFHPLLPKG